MALDSRPSETSSGTVTVDSVPADPFGLNADAASATGSLSAKLRLLAEAIKTEDGVGSSNSSGFLSLGRADLDDYEGTTHAVSDNGDWSFLRVFKGALGVRLVASDTASENAKSIAAREDDAHTSADAGVKILAVRKATPANLSGTDGDYEPLQVSDGCMWVRPVPERAPIIVTPSLDTSAYAAGDVLFTTTAIAAATLVNNGTSKLKKLVLFDGDAQGAAMDIYLLQDSTTIGTFNAAPNITDANLDPPNLMDVIGVAAADWKTISGAKVCSIDFGEGLSVQAGAATTTVYIAAVTQGAPTHTASGIVISAWFKP